MSEPEVISQLDRDVLADLQAKPALALTGYPPRNCPFANSGPERLGSIPISPVAVTLLAVAHEAAAHQVLADGQAATDLGDDVIEGRVAAKWITAVGAAVVPDEVDLIARGAACDQAGLVNVVLIH